MTRTVNNTTWTQDEMADGWWNTDYSRFVGKRNDRKWTACDGNCNVIGFAGSFKEACELANGEVV